MRGEMPPGREVYRQDFNENVLWWMGKISPDWHEEGDISNGKNSRSQLTDDGKFKTYLEYSKCRGVRTWRWEDSGSPNGQDLEQEEKEFTCFWYTSRFNVRSQMGHKDHVRIWGELMMARK